MEYLWWFVPGATAPMLIALVATVHVLVSHYAVGGGIWLAFEATHAHRTKNAEYLGYLRQHAFFFTMITVVFGAITGVGIWWTIGLASPLATELLIRTFVFGWATEWVFFLVELTAAFLFLYRWGKVSTRTHLAYGWIYAFSAWASLVIITGVTAFMLDPGRWIQATSAGTGEPHFWLAFFNPQFLPQTVYRTGMALMLTSAYIAFHASLFLQKPEKADLRKQVLRRDVWFLGVGLFLVLAGGVWAFFALPELARMTMLRAAMAQILTVLGVGGLFALAAVGAALAWKPQWASPLAGVLMLGMAFAVLAAGEFVREAIRKPYVVMGVVQGNQMHVNNVEKTREAGLLESGTWTKKWVLEKFPAVGTEDGKLDLTRLTSEEDKLAVGKAIFMHHCNDCHDIGCGYVGVKALATMKTREGLLQFIKNLNDMVYYMPPWCGNDVEAELLTDYLMKTADAYPQIVPPQAVATEQPAERKAPASETGAASETAPAEAAPVEAAPAEAVPTEAAPVETDLPALEAPESEPVTTPAN